MMWMWVETTLLLWDDPRALQLKLPCCLPAGSEAVFLFHVGYVLGQTVWRGQQHIPHPEEQDAISEPARVLLSSAIATGTPHTWI